jgi:hypothetical protein
MPVFGTGHAGVKFDVALRAMFEALNGIDGIDIVIVVNDPERAERAKHQLTAMLSSATVTTP